MKQQEQRRGRRWSAWSERVISTTLWTEGQGFLLRFSAGFRQAESDHYQSTSPPDQESTHAHFLHGPLARSSMDRRTSRPSSLAENTGGDASAPSKLRQQYTDPMVQATAKTDRGNAKGPEPAGDRV